jgi:chromosome segregation ATPase
LLLIALFSDVPQGAEEQGIRSVELLLLLGQIDARIAGSTRDVKEFVGVKVDALESSVKDLAAKQETMAGKQETMEASVKDLAASVKDLAAKQETMAGKQETMAGKQETMEASVKDLAASVKGLAAKQETMAAKQETMAVSQEKTDKTVLKAQGVGTALVLLCGLLANIARVRAFWDGLH